MYILQFSMSKTVYEVVIHHSRSLHMRVNARARGPGIYRAPYPNDAQSRTVVGLPGFEPGSREPESRSLNQIGQVIP